MNIVFFGSFQLYSVQVLSKLTKNFSVTAVITTSPKPAGRHMALKPTEVQRYATKNNIPVYPLASLVNIPNKMQKPDFFVVAGYGKLIPPAWLDFPKIMAINMHASLLPHYRGAFPAEWAILRGEIETGVSLVKMSAEFDKGEILIQKKLAIAPRDTRETLYTKLYDLGGDLLVEYLPKAASGSVKSTPQGPDEFFYARRITREDGFIAWAQFKESLTANPASLDTKFRAFTPWPGVWTRLPSLRPPATTSSSEVGRGSGFSGQATTPQKKRLKLISIYPPIVQLEGKNPVPFAQFISAYSLLTEA